MVMTRFHTVDAGWCADGMGDAARDADRRSFSLVVAHVLLLAAEKGRVLVSGLAGRPEGGRETRGRWWCGC